MNLLKVLGLKKCTHERMNTHAKYGYCPDCGAFVENRWYLVRCSCCGIKRIAITKMDTIMPATQFCKNCGCEEYIVEELENLNFVDVNYATLVRITPEQSKENFSQSWVVNENKSIKFIENKISA